MKEISPPLAITGAGAISSHGVGWRGLGRALLKDKTAPKPCSLLANSHANVLAYQVSEVPAGRSPEEKRARMLMSQSALLASIACEAALSDAGWSESPADVGFYLGVGASGGSMDQLEVMLAQSVEAGEISLKRLGDQGLRACHPLFAFQLMNNFTLCHSAILQGVRGPNAAFFSRGAGTLMAALEAIQCVTVRDSERVLVGGADSSLHPVTYDEILREGYPKDGFVGGEGAALIALEALEDAGRALALLEQCTLASSIKTLSTTWAEVTRGLAGKDIGLVVMAPWGNGVRDALSVFVRRALPGVPIVDTTAHFGDALAATPALAWVSALDLLVANEAERALVLSAGIDGPIGLVVLARGRAA